MKPPIDTTALLSRAVRVTAPECRQLLLAGCAFIATQLAVPAAIAQNASVSGKTVNDSTTVRNTPIAPNVEQETGSSGSIPFAISVDGEALVGSQQSAAKTVLAEGPRRKTSGRQSPDSQRRTDVGLAGVDVQVKYDGLDIKPLLNVSTTPVRRSYKAGETVRMLAQLRLDPALGRLFPELPA